MLTTSCRRETNNAPCFFGLRSFLCGSGTLVLTGNLSAKFISCHAHGSFHSLGDLYPVSIDRPLAVMARLDSRHRHAYVSAILKSIESSTCIYTFIYGGFQNEMLFFGHDDSFNTKSKRLK
jgi:hypothetical protein